MHANSLRAWRLSAIILESLALTGFLSAWLLKNDMNIFAYFISEYANGSYGWITTSSFVMMGIGIVLSSATHLEYHSKIKALMLATYGLLILCLGIFPSDVRSVVTLKGTVHIAIASVVFPYFFLLAWPYWRDVSRILAASAIISTIVSLLGLTLLWSSSASSQGIAQRIAVMSQCVFMYILALHMYFFRKR